jgi:hypothetical protein
MSPRKCKADHRLGKNICKLSRKRFISKIAKELLQFNNKNIYDLIKIGQKVL